MAIASQRTPEVRFAALPGFAFHSSFADALPGFAGLRMHYVDVAAEGAETGVVLCLHGQPTWSYLYRRMIPHFTKHGYRVVAPDFFGFGRSDKPIGESAYTFEFHRNSVLALIQHLALRNMTLVCQDWGGLIGLTIPMELQDRFDALMVMNTTLATGDAPLTQGFLDWRAWSNAHPDMPIGALLKRATPHLTAGELAAYEAPFPDASFKAGVRRFPNLVPDHVDADGAAISRRARAWWRSSWMGRTAMVVGANDPVLGPQVMNSLAQIVRGCPEPIMVENGGHFVQEWADAFLGRALAVLQTKS